MTDHRSPLTITVHPWFHDHFIGSTVVLAAVETMRILAGHCLESHPGIDVRIMEDVRFAKFLEIPPGTTSLTAQVQCTGQTDGRLQARLQSHVQLKSMTRIKEHGEIFFPLASGTLPPSRAVNPTPPSTTALRITAQRIYAKLVPFGPRYHTLRDTLYLENGMAWGQIRTPDIPLIAPVQSLIGSPFPLDGALHAACVLGQQLVDFVPFPVGFGRRVIFCPTQPGGVYATRVTLTARTTDELTFDLDIFDKAGKLYETVDTMRMRNVGMAGRK